jgi:hypothetical protein
MFLSLISCSKDDSTTKTLDVPGDLVGSWSWISSCGGYGGGCRTPESTGEIRKIYFHSDHSYKYYVNENLKYEGVFHLEIARSITGNDSALILTTQNLLPQSITFRTTDTLELFEECYDGFQHNYNRIK